VMRKASDILRTFLDRATADNAQLYHSFFKGWERIAGEQIAAHSAVTDVHNGTVVIEVDHPGWIQLIQLQQDRILRELRRGYPQLAIRGLRMQLARQEMPTERTAGSERVRDRPEPERETSAEVPPAGNTEERRKPDPVISQALKRLSEAIRERTSKD